MSSDRSKARRRKAWCKTGDARSFEPTVKVDALTLLVDAADKDTPIKTELKRAPRNKDGQSTNYAGFGDQYFRLKSSLVREQSVMLKSGDRLAYLPRRTTQEQLVAQAGPAIAAGLASPLPNGQRVPDNYKFAHKHRVSPCPNGKAWLPKHLRRPKKSPLR